MNCATCGRPLRTDFSKFCGSSCYAASGEFVTTAYEPTPEEIAAEAAAIREGWTRRDYFLRAGVSRRSRTWVPPVVRSVLGAR